MPVKGSDGDWHFYCDELDYIVERLGDDDSHMLEGEGYEFTKFQKDSMKNR